MYKLSDLSHLMPAAIWEALKKESRFDDTLADAIAFVNELTGMSLTPESDVAAYPWLKLPLAWLIKKMACGYIAMPSPELVTQLENDYREALKILASHKTTEKREAKRAVLGQFTDAFGDTQ